MNSLRYFDFGSSRSLLLLIARIAIVVPVSYTHLTLPTN